MSSPTIASIVEGHGEVQAIPLLVRRIGSELCGVGYVDLPKPYRLPRGKMLRPDEIERVVTLLSARLTTTGGTLLVLDADEDCVLDLRDQIGRMQLPGVHVAVAVPEYEAWLLAGLGVSDAEERRDAKGRFADRLSISYHPAIDQARHTARLDLRTALEHSRSLRHLVSVVAKLVSA